MLKGIYVKSMRIYTVLGRSSVKNKNLGKSQIIHYPLGCFNIFQSKSHLVRGTLYSQYPTLEDNDVA